MTEILSSAACDNCAVTPAHAHMADNFFTVNGSNMVVCLAHAVELETAHADYTFQAVTIAVAAWLVAA